MKGDTKVIEYLNAALRSELTAINQYWLHYRLQEDWGYGKILERVALDRFHLARAARGPGMRPPAPQAGASAPTSGGRMPSGRNCMSPIQRNTLASVVVTLPPGAQARADALKGLGVTLLEVPQAAEGMAASLRAGATEALQRGAAGLMVLPADMPEITASDIEEMIAAFRAAAPPPILRATTQAGEPGHPVIFPAQFFHALTQIEGDRGARDVLTRDASQIVDYALPDTRARVDLDTPEDWATWRARNPER
jgi:molybdenum cofactor cytidylyltransferase